MLSPDKAKAGQKAISARTWNSLVDMLDWWKRNHALGSGGGRLNGPRETDLIRLRNDTGEALDKYSVLQVDEYLLTDTGGDIQIDRMRMFFGGSKPINGAALVAALQWTAAEDEIVEAQISGVGMALVDVGATWHRRAYPTRDETVLTSGIFGPFEILGELEDTGEQTCLVRMGQAANRSIMGVVQTDGITAATYASSDLTMGYGDVVLLAPHSSTVGKYTLTSGEGEQEVVAYNMASGSIAAGKIVLLTPSDDWLPLVEVESCD
jgi:hypothetical protein